MYGLADDAIERSSVKWESNMGASSKKQLPKFWFWLS